MGSNKAKYDQLKAACPPGCYSSTTGTYVAAGTATDLLGMFSLIWERASNFRLSSIWLISIFGIHDFFSSSSAAKGSALVGEVEAGMPNAYLRRSKGVAAPRRHLAELASKLPHSHWKSSRDTPSMKKYIPAFAWSFTERSINCLILKRR